MQQFNYLFTPINIGTIEIRNRIVMLPLTTGFCENDETVGNRFITFYAERAKGGVGLIVTGCENTLPVCYDHRRIDAFRPETV